MERLEERLAYRVTFHTYEISTNNVLWIALQNSAQVLSFEPGLKHLDEAFMDLTEPGVPV